MALPLALRNRLADLVLDGLHDPTARRTLKAIAAVCAGRADRDEEDALHDADPGALFERRDGRWRIKSGWRQHAAEMAERAARASRALCGRPLDPPDASLGIALAAAGSLFDARLYFEVHELLEPHWRDATGESRDALQGLIQIAVGYQHLANGNLAGARALLDDGTTRTRGRSVAGIDCDAFARAARATIARLTDGPTAPDFPRRRTS